MSSHETLAATANDRKSRLAHLKSLKRKQAPAEDDASISEIPSTSIELARTESDGASVTKAFLSGRNYDPETRNVKLGFEEAPIADKEKTLEYRAQQLAIE